MSTFYEKPQPGVDYCGYCKSDYDENGNCQCNGHGHAIGTIGTCGYCGDDYGEDFECSCDGFGGDKQTHERTCRWCAFYTSENPCPNCGMAS